MNHLSFVKPELPVLRPFGFVGQLYPPASCSAEDFLMTLLPATKCFFNRNNDKGD